MRWRNRPRSNSGNLNQIKRRGDRTVASPFVPYCPETFLRAADDRGDRPCTTIEQSIAKVTSCHHTLQSCHEWRIEVHIQAVVINITGKGAAYQFDVPIGQDGCTCVHISISRDLLQVHLTA